ncbi:MAG: zinc ABC transporter substrate-binding protein [Cytophagales bacterium]|nr:zinc ABC transporter substrate-binding protein [Cytophagales bacterium]
MNTIKTIFMTLFFATQILGAAKEKIKVLCTTTIIYDITRNIANESIEVTCLLPYGSDPHIYEPTPKDALKVAQADIIIKNGLLLEGWLNELITTSAHTHIIAEAAENIVPIKNIKLHSSPDPHAWMSPLHGITYAKNIAKVLVDNDPEHQEIYQANFETYKKSLLVLHNYIKTEINKINPTQRILITSHDAFRYYGNLYGIKVQSALGTSTDAEVQISDMENLINTINKSKIPAIFIESTINPKLLRQLANDQKIKIGGKLYADSIGDSLSVAPSYLAMLKYNTDTIVQGLTQNANITFIDQDLAWLIGVALFLFIWAFVGVYVMVLRVNKVHTNWNNYKIEVKNLTVSYEKKTVLSNINFTLQSGGIFGLLGPNGAGKSTLFKSILGLIKPDTGDVIINGLAVEDIRPMIAYIPQKEEIDWTFPASVYDIVLTGRLPHKQKYQTYNKDDKLKAHDAIQKMGLEEYEFRQIGDLSGGQQQRVFIARALCQEAELLFFDEPFVGVDITTEEKIIQMIKKMAQNHKTIIMIHHDLSKVKEYFDKVIMVNQSLIAYGDTDITFTQNNIAKTYRGKLSILQEADKYVF